MSRVNAILTRRALIASNALLQRCVYGASSVEQATTGSRRWPERRPSSFLSGSAPASLSQSIKNFINAAQFERKWYAEDSDSRKRVSIWRPIPPPGCIVFGDCLVEGMEPPRFGVGLRDDETGTFMNPKTYLPQLYVSGNGVEDAYFWRPEAPTGYVAMGCIVTRTPKMPPVDLVRCIRSGHVTRGNFSEKPSWSTDFFNHKGSLWKMETPARTFMAQPDLERPPAGMAHYLGNFRHKSAADKCYRSTFNERYSSTSGWLTTGRLTATVLVGLGVFTLNHFYPLSRLIPLALKCAGRLLR